jgi:hypothetical protein
MGEYFDRTFMPEGDDEWQSAGEQKRRAATKENEKQATLKTGAEQGVADALASGAVKKVEDQTSSIGIVGKLQSIFTSPSGVLGKARTASRRLLS